MLASPGREELEFLRQSIDYNKCNESTKVLVKRLPYRDFFQKKLDMCTLHA